MNFVIYLFISSVCLIVSFVCFRFTANKSGFHQQRIFLISSLLLSLILPLTGLRITVPKIDGSSVKMLSSTNFITNSYMPSEKTGFNFPDFTDLFLYVYISIAVLLILIAFFQIIRIPILMGLCRKEKIGNFDVFRSSKIKNPFSFFRFVFIPESLSDPKERDSVIIHERVHASQLHSLDNILLGFASALLWFNPVIWIMKNTIHLLHEYQADDGTIKSGIEKLKYQELLLNQVTEGKLIYIHSPFNNNLLKKRMIMITKNEKTENGRLRFLNILSLSAVLFLAVALISGFFPEEAKASESLQDQKKGGAKITISDVKDEPLNFIVDGISVKNIDNLNPDSIESVNVMKTDRLVVVRTKSFARKQAESSVNNSQLQESALYILDGRRVTKSEVDKVSTDKIEKVEVIKDKEMVRKYGEEGKNGVIIITTKP